GWSAVPYLAISYALLCLTHLPLAFATTLMIPVYLGILTRNPRHFLRVGAGLVLGIGLSFFFLASVLLERQYVRSMRRSGLSTTTVFSLNIWDSCGASISLRARIIPDWRAF